MRIKPKIGVLLATDPYDYAGANAEEQRVEQHRDEARAALARNVREWPVCGATGMPVGFTLYIRRSTQEIGIKWRCTCGC